MSFVACIEKYKDGLVEAPFFYRLIITFVAGITLSFIQAPYHLWPLLFMSFGLFYFLYAQAQTKKQAFLTGFVFAFGYFLVGLSWIGNALLVEGNEYKWAWPLAVIALPALLSLFTALYTVIAHIVFRKNHFSGFLGFCVCLALSEWVRGYVFTGFPWNLYGYGWIDVLPIAQSVSVIGSYGLTLLTIFWGALVGFCGLNFSNHKRALAFGVLSFAFVYGVGAMRLTTPVEYHQGVKIQLVQANIAQTDKWNPEKLVQNFNDHIELSMMKSEGSSDKNIIIWPETAIPPSFLHSPAVRERIQSVLGNNDILLAGALDVTREPKSGTSRYHNVLTLWQPHKNKFERLYSKSHLVPFGEYIPFQKYIPLETVTHFSGFERGSGNTIIKVKDFPSFSPLICYEIIFPQLIANNNDSHSDFILTVTNDGWYGKSSGPYQHFSQTRFRAIEQGAPAVRSANTGVSGVIDSYGRVVKSSLLLESSVITASLPRKILSKTPYSMYRDALFIGFSILCLLPSIVFKRKGFL